MQTAVPQNISCAHSPDSDDAFMFYALATQKIRSNLLTFRHVLSDIETLNREALRSTHEITAISYHAYPYVADNYVLMSSGSSVGDGYGPLVVARHPLAPQELKGKRIAVPGKMTTAYLALKLYEPDFVAVVTPFDKILDAVNDHSVTAGLVIHEAQLTYSSGGFHAVLDLGAWWKQTQGLPLPLGANALLRSLSAEVKEECCRLMRDSIQYALDHPAEALAYALQFAGEMEAALAEKFVGLYVNHHTLDCGDLVPKAAQRLLDMGYEAGLIARKVQVEFIR
jgi:1,4-dihydroxy-6-naphthoate synthase